MGKIYMHNQEVIDTAKKLLLLNQDEYMECGEINLTKLAEDTAFEMNQDQWLDDPEHWIWDIAFDVAEEFEQKYMK